MNLFENVNIVMSPFTKIVKKMAKNCFWKKSYFSENGCNIKIWVCSYSHYKDFLEIFKQILCHRCTNLLWSIFRRNCYCEKTRHFL